MNIDWTLLRRSMIRSLTEEEQQILNEWLEESPQHRELYHHIQVFWQDQETFRPGTEKIHQFKEDYERSLSECWRRKQRQRIFRLSRMAALFILAVGGAFFLLSEMNQRKRLELTQHTETTNPGKNRALLVTDDGKTISLSNRMQEVEVSTGIKVSNCANALVYSDTASLCCGGENCLLVPRGGEYSVCLSDGTVVWLNSASELKYPVCFTDSVRKVYLKGEAYFQVTHRKDKAFVVITDEVEVKVYGTEFNMNTRVVAGVQTTLVEGCVAMKSRGGKEQMLCPDQMAEYCRATGKIVIRDVDVSQYIGWKSGIYLFEDQSIEQILGELSLWYDVEVFFKHEEARQQRFSGSLPRYRDIKDMLSVLEKTTHVSFEVKGRTVVVN